MSKKTKILLLYQFDSHQFIIDCLIENIDREKFDVDYFNSKTFKYSGSNSVFLKLLQQLVRIPKFRVVVYLLLRNRLIENIANKYQIVDIHFFSQIYDRILPKLQAKLKVTFWGSDIYRVSEERRSNFPTLLKNVCLVHATTPMMESYFEKYNNLQIPVVTLPIGIKNFELILDATRNLEKNELKKQLEIPENKHIITLGYNANPSQQHLKILNQLSELSIYQKEKCFLIVPLTYAGNKFYINEVKRSLDLLRIQYLVLENYLDLETKNLYTIASDIAINIQTTDGFSASIQEYFLTQNIMLLGEWLPYKWLKEKGIQFSEINEDNLCQQLESVLEGFEEYKKATSGNTKIIYEISSWHAISSSWNNIYTQLI